MTYNSDAESDAAPDNSNPRQTTLDDYSVTEGAARSGKMMRSVRQLLRRESDSE
jgi:hypothetical protein